MHIAGNTEFTKKMLTFINTIYLLRYIYYLYNSYNLHNYVVQDIDSTHFYVYVIKDSFRWKPVLK